VTSILPEGSDSKTPPPSCDNPAVGDRVWFHEEKAPYRVRAVTSDGRYAICTKPFNPKRTVLYTVIDWHRERRGADNYYGLGYETPEQIANALDYFERGKAELSRRNSITLNIVRVARG
jgi:hypothetical protein